jgi:hypothetical protein
VAAFAVMNVQCVLGLIAFSLIARWYVGPALTRLKLEDALAALCLFHAFRYVALGVYAPGQVSPVLPDFPVNVIVAGDVASGILALVAAIMLKARAPGAIAAAWIFNIVGVLDILASVPLAMIYQLYNEPLGFSWYVFTFYVPALIVTHVMMLAWLARRHPAKLTHALHS